jgi:integrase/recombinase XerD
MSTNGIRHIFNRYVRLSDIKKDITPHSLRHTFICHAIEDGIPLLEIMSIVGHEDIKTTMVYTHILQMNHSYINKFKEF